VTTKADRLHGTVKRLFLPRGFGYITGEDGRDYFIHATELQDSEWSAETIREGDKVEFEPQSNGDRALKVVVL